MTPDTTTAPPNEPANGGPITVDSRELTHHIGAVFIAEPTLPVGPNLVADFARTTGADHWMHLDHNRARTTPLGRTTVQGLLTLSLGAELERRALVVRASDAVFRGFDRVRFPAPMFVGDPLGLRVEILAAEESRDGIRVRLRHTFTSVGPKPVCVSEHVVGYTHWVR